MRDFPFGMQLSGGTRNAANRALMGEDLCCEQEQGHGSGEFALPFPSSPILPHYYTARVSSYPKPTPKTGDQIQSRVPNCLPESLERGERRGEKCTFPRSVALQTQLAAISPEKEGERRIFDLPPIPSPHLSKEKGGSCLEYLLLHAPFWQT